MNTDPPLPHQETKREINFTSRRSFLISAPVCGAACLGGAFSNQSGVTLQEDIDADLQTFVTDQCRSAVKKGLDFLQGRQNDDGSFGSGLYSRNVAVVSLAAIAMLCSGDTPGRGALGNSIKRSVEFVIGQARESGFINAQEFQSHGPMYGHGFATLLLAIVHGSPGIEVKNTLSKAVNVILQSQNDEGGWRYQPRRNEADLSVTVCQVMALRAAKNAGIFVPSDVVEKSVDYIKRCQNPDGGFRYRLEEVESAFARTAAALVALYSAGIYKGREIEKGLGYLMKDFVPTKENQTAMPHFHYGHYYAIQAMWHAGGKYWGNWYPALRDRLIETQQTKDGSWDETISPEYVTAMSCICLQIPYNLVPIFQR